MSYDFSKITERLFCGSQINSAQDVADAKAAGITHIIDCCESNDSIDVEGSGIALLWDATADDGTHKGIAWFQPGVDFGIGALSHPGYKVLTHCVAGVNRGPSMAYAILCAQGLTPLRAIGLLHGGRPICNGGIRYADDADAALKLLGWTRGNDL